MPAAKDLAQARILYRNLRVLAALSVVFLGALAIAPAKEHLT